MTTGRLAVWVVLALAAVVAPAPGAAAADQVVQDPRVEGVFALDGTLVYRRSGAPSRRAWMRVVQGRARRSHGVPAQARGSAIGRDRAGRVVLTMVVERFQGSRRVDARWWLYDVVGDRSRRLGGLPQGRCAPTAVAVWRARMAYAVECGSTSVGGVFLRDPGGLRRVAPALWSAGWSVSLTLRGDELAASREFDEDVEIHRLVADDRVCRTLIDSISMEDWTTFGPWLGRGKLMWGLQELYPPIGQPTMGAVVGTELVGRCRKRAPIGGLAPGAPLTWARDRAVDGRRLYSVDRSGIQRERLSASLELRPPPNDDFEDATPLDGDPPMHIAALIGRGTSEPGEPAGGPSMGTAWYAFRPATTQQVRISSPTVTIFTGTELTSLTRVGELDPIDVLSGWIVNAVAGETYWIQLRCGQDSACFVPRHVDIRTDVGPPIGLPAPTDGD